MRDAALGDLTPPRSGRAERQRRSYPRVELPHPGRALALLEEPARWPDMSCAAGRITALRRGGLEGQTFEIEVALEGIPRAPVLTRGYVTATAVWRAGDPVLDRGLEALGVLGGEPVVPAGGQPLVHVELTTHDGHFLDRAISHVVLGEHAAGGGWACNVGEWDRLPRPQEMAYKSGGEEAQRAFWGPGDPELSVLEQLARITA